MVWDNMSLYLKEGKFYFIFSLHQLTCIDIFYTHITFNTPWYFLVCTYIAPIYLDAWGAGLCVTSWFVLLRFLCMNFWRSLKHPNRWTIWQYLHTSMLENSETRISPNKNLKIWFLPHVTQLHLDCEDESVDAVQAYNWCLLWQSVKNPMHMVRANCGILNVKSCSANRNHCGCNS